MKEKMGINEEINFHFLYKCANIRWKFNISNHAKKIFQKMLKN